MPAIVSRDVAVALDMFGCPNRCRHCYLGHLPNGRMAEGDLRRLARMFRDYVRSGEDAPFFNRLTVFSWFREPDYGPDYSTLYTLENELSTAGARRFELLSIWRLARDPGYAVWARRLQTDTCQISFFGVGETQDWFYGRRGAWQDCLKATERLLDVGIKPRWQFFLTRRILPEIDTLMHLVERMRLPQRVEALGGTFQMFIHPPGPDGAARHIEHLRPTPDETRALPADLVEASRAYLGRDPLWQTEADLLEQIRTTEPHYPHTYAYPERLCFYVTRDWDVYSNMGTLDPWWRLGNLLSDGVDGIVRCFERDGCPGLQVVYHLSPRDLARRYGDPSGTRVYSNADDLLALYLARHCELART